MMAILIFLLVPLVPASIMTPECASQIGLT